MKTADFIREHNACREGAKWALSVSSDMAEVWDELLNQGKHDWLFWVATRPGVFSGTVVRKLSCRFVRETPLHDGRTVWDLLTDERSRMAVEVAERYADGNATEAELAAAYAAANAAHAAASARSAARAASAVSAARAAYFAARAAADVAYSAAYAAASWPAFAAARDAADAAAYTARAAAYAAAHIAARDAARDANSAQIKMIAQLGNPFKKES